MPHVVFDIVGTCFTYERFFAAIEARLGDKMLAAGIKPRLFGYTWTEVAEREYTYLSMTGRYLSFQHVFKSLFYRMLWFSGIKEPRAFATDADVEACLDGWRHLGPRQGLQEAMQKLRDAGFTVWCFTTGDAKRILGYFQDAGVEMAPESILSCDTLGLSKPAPEAYKNMLGRFEGQEVWFAAAHSWDASAAREFGFKTAYCSEGEKEPCYDIFGKYDAEGVTIVEMADALIAKSKGATQ
ncbi:HAD-like protein [Xylona heveae TC161]|uniref:HAD-like protein n=1 Tax=Xylona heveae (strain CBS 132557 / TC161) TaxID=1328760 RepID=A0A165J888_XYLHT|nr:HAD-like protein [Xylona heveae TC161]KZF25881.1 HAD-like protein [Xylona heveae TC161]